MAETPSDASASGVSAGRMLRAARERHGLSVQEVADGLNLRTGIIEALEGDRYDLLPPRTFVKGYLRAYAKLVGVKEYGVLAAFEQQQPEPESQPVPAITAGREPAGAGFKWLVAAVVVLLLAYVAYSALAPRQQESAVPAAVQEEAQPVEPLTEPLGDEPPETGAAVVESQVVESVESQTLEEAPMAEPPAAQSVDQAETEAPQSAVQPLGQAETEAPPAEAGLVLEVTGESWIEIEDANGAQPLSSLVQGPQTIEIAGAAPFRLVIGNAEAVQVRYTGQAVPLAPYTRRSGVARLTVPRSP